MSDLEDATPATVTQELPVLDYKHLPRLEIERHVLGLDEDATAVLLRYECDHRARTPVIRLLTARLRHLRADRRKQP
ncbi:hypothetical protein SAMN05216251_12848 [Actinacidiphila alni]|uniref:Uncharacterized protein n=1 Tax=Actinacidiphila alni TaxID=380248 RepID=A0A1I2LD99_9ACTN|nr:hypothetical protein [Actinacidiphila alni]SFF77372.1 hypothetical protein SAMN05216251_12848 [Actinacidiphila alni]